MNLTVMHSSLQTGHPQRLVYNSETSKYIITSGGTLLKNQTLVQNRTVSKMFHVGFLYSFESY